MSDHDPYNGRRPGLSPEFRRVVFAVLAVIVLVVALLVLT